MWATFLQSWSAFFCTVEGNIQATDTGREESSISIFIKRCCFQRAACKEARERKVDTSERKRTTRRGDGLCGDRQENRIEGYRTEKIVDVYEKKGEMKTAGMVGKKGGFASASYGMLGVLYKGVTAVKNEAHAKSSGVYVCVSMRGTVI